MKTIIYLYFPKIFKYNLNNQKKKKKKEDQIEKSVKFILLYKKTISLI